MNLEKERIEKFKTVKGVDLIKELKKLFNSLDKKSLKNFNYRNSNFIKFRILKNKKLVRDYSFFNHIIVQTDEYIEFRTIKGKEENWNKIDNNSNIEILFKFDKKKKSSMVILNETN